MVRLRRYKKIIGFADTIIVNSQLSIVHSDFHTQHRLPNYP